MEPLLDMYYISQLKFFFTVNMEGMQYIVSNVCNLTPVLDSP